MYISKIYFILPLKLIVDGFYGVLEYYPGILIYRDYHHVQLLSFFLSITFTIEDVTESVCGVYLINDVICFINVKWGILRCLGLGLFYFLEKSARQTYPHLPIKHLT